MTRDSIRDEHHIARHLNPKKIEESGLPAEHAFEPKAGSRMVSVNWLERFDGEPDQEAQLERVREVLGRRREIKPSHRLALLNVGSAKQAVRNSLADGAALGVLEPLGVEAAIDVVEDPDLDSPVPDPSHAHIMLPELPEYHELAAAALRGVVRPQDMRPALAGSSQPDRA